MEKCDERDIDELMLPIGPDLATDQSAEVNVHGQFPLEKYVARRVIGEKGERGRRGVEEEEEEDVDAFPRALYRKFNATPTSDEKE